MAKPQSPILIKPIPTQVINEGAGLHPFDLNQFIQSPPDSGTVRFAAELASGASLPQGLICTADGLLSGIPAKGTQGAYQVIIVAENDSLIPLTTEFMLTIKERIGIVSNETLNALKAQVWEALKQDLPLPDLGNFAHREITAVEIYYLLQKFATLTIWDVYSLDSPGEKVLLPLEEASPHYHVYDRGSCLVAAPKDLFSHERTLEDALQTARAIAREAFKRHWVIEFAGFHKMIRAAWVELQHLSQKYERKVEIMHYKPTAEDVQLYVTEAKSLARITL